MRKYVIGILLLILVGCGLETETFAEFYSGEVTRIEIVSGETGEKRSIEDLERVNRFIDQVEDVQFHPQENQEKRDGFRYSIRLYNEDKKVFGCTLTMVDGHYYDTEPDLYSIVDKWFKRLTAQ
ncbi:MULTISPECIES: hypothetical protein [Pontibacillus]|uniref:Uncharacterized protein n=1 Tax=Pontibacillus chungwhensis TaxID=265426 RepID=A0ABY8UU07_9BACI|nr:MULTISPECIES: hypothetical protein [Pontibacillus]MCD5323435.1 hypothetical protein [Pontibacillus sp. HN14]WIF96815.1 hypothetical protein QNI29_13765 [Pontibacillus chungwhensis]